MESNQPRWLPLLVTEAWLAGLTVNLVDLPGAAERLDSKTNSVPAEQEVPAVVESSLIIPVKSPHTAGLEVLVDFSNFTMIDFMIWKGVAVVIGAAIYGFWLGFTE